MSIAVKHREVDPLDVEGIKRRFLVPLRKRGRLVVGALSLRKHEPVRLVCEVREGELFFLLCAVIGFHRLGALAGKRHAKDQRFFTLLHVPSKVLPLRESGQRSRLDAALEALEERQELIAKRVVVEA